MSEETSTYGDVNLVDDMNKHLQEAFTLADLLTHYSPSYEGRNAFGSTVENAGFMLQNALVSARGSIDKPLERKAQS